MPRPKKGVSVGFVISLVLVVGLITIFIWRIFGNKDRSTHITTSGFIQSLYEDKIETVTIAHYAGSERVVITGDARNLLDDSIKYQYTYITDNANYQSVVYEIDGEEFTICELLNKKLDEAKIEYVDLYQTTWWDNWGPTIIILLVSTALCIFLFSRLTHSVGGANKQAMDFGKSRARRVLDSKVRFKDVAGCDEEKAEMMELVEYLKDPQKFTRFGAKLPKGVLLVGHPGTGKTLLAKAVAGEAGVPFFSISGSDFVEMFVGVGAGRVRDMFANAKKNAPCLVFIDEIDAVGRQRGAGLGGGNDEREQTLNQLLVEMDGFSDNSGIIVIAATNRDDVLDPALLRAGRFDRKITVSLPDKEGRKAIFLVHSRNKKLAPEVNFDAIAERTVGFSGADIENIMNEAAILAVRSNKPCIGMDEIDEAIDRRVAGPAKSSHSMNKHERDIVAHHEAGHAIVGLKLEHSDKVQKITIIPRGNTGGHVRMTPEEDRFLLTKKELEARIVGYLGGRSSEEVFFDDISSGAQNDIEMATRIARMMVTELGMSSLGPIQYERDTGSVFLGRDYTSSQKNFSLATAEQIDSEVKKIIDDAHKLAVSIIKKHKDEVDLIAKTLLKYEQITAEEIDYLLKNGHLQREEAKVQMMNEETKKPEEIKIEETPQVKKVVKKTPSKTTKKSEGKKVE
ncbi:MAG: ATP-dependent zinc metalloprotease FtsH [Bacilli bacterium]|nr:ATP-dependent zinc metalloprotease FtsH [Bacilli bacterium]